MTCVLVIDYCLEDLYFDIFARELMINEIAFHLRQMILNFLSSSFPVLGLASWEACPSLEYLIFSGWRTSVHYSKTPLYL